MTTPPVGEILNGVWRFEALHPEWTEEEGGEEGWEPLVAWWSVRTPEGLVLVDPLIDDWPPLDDLVSAEGGCAGLVRTCHWHQRSIGEAAARYRAEVWAKPDPDGDPEPRFDHGITDGQEMFSAITAFEVERDDEVALWVAEANALIFGDAMLRRRAGELRVCPDGWTQPEGGAARLRSVLKGLTRLPVEHVLVSHGPLVLGDGSASLRRALG